MNELNENINLNVNLHGIEMRGLNEEHQIIYSNQNHEVNEVVTQSGIPLRIYIKRSQKATALLTFHDIGTNHNSFLNFFNCPEMLVILENFTVYNICAPGHESQESKFHSFSHSTDEKFNLLSSGKSSEDSDSGIFTIGSAPKPRTNIPTYPSMNDLAEMIEDVVEHYQLKLFLGMGVGAGANVMARYGMRYPGKLLGLFLINPDDTTMGFLQYTKARWSGLPALKSGVVSDWMQSYLLDHWFGYVSDRNLDVQEYHLQLMRDISLTAIAGYVESYMSRTALGLIRSIADMSGAGRTIDVDTLLVTGESATDLVKAMVNMNANLSPSKSQFLSIPNSSGMVMDDAPSRLAVVFLNFLRNIGIMVAMTPEKLQKVILERQTLLEKGPLTSETVLASQDYC